MVKVPTDIEKSSSTSSANSEPDAGFGGSEARRALEKKLIRKLDMRLLYLVILYVFNYVDRNNVSAARLRGFEEDLHLTDREFDTVLSIFYLGYVIMQVPSNMLLVYMGKPSIYLPVCMIFWGTISALTGITTNYTGVVMARFFLGLVETAFFPGALFLLSKWYKRDEMGLRTSTLVTGSILGFAFGPLLASGILDSMDGKLGHAGWRWLFYIEGSMTVFLAIIGLFIIPDFPASSSPWWLSPAELHLAKRRIEEDNDFDSDGGGETVTTGLAQGLVMALKDWKVWWLGITVHIISISSSFNAFFPTLSKTMGFNNEVTLILCAPPWLLAAVSSFVVNRHSDMTGERFLHIAFSLLVGMTGFVIAMSTMNTAARYLSLFLMSQTIAAIGAFYAWASNIVQHSTKRAVFLALVTSFSQLGNIPGAYIWPIRWGPTYRYSFAICFTGGGVSIIMCYILREHLRRENKRLEKEGLEQRKFRYML